MDIRMLEMTRSMTERHVDDEAGWKAMQFRHHEAGDDDGQRQVWAVVGRLCRDSCTKRQVLAARGPA
jgi:hypothetical protein